MRSAARWLCSIGMVLSLMGAPEYPPIYLIAWDMGGVLVDVSIIRMMRSIGAMACISYHLGYTTAPDQLQNKIFDTLDICGGMQAVPASRVSYHTAHRPLPNLMCAWLAGTLEPLETLLPWLEQHIDELYEQGFFMNELEHRIIKSAVRHIFNPQTLIQNTYIVQDTYELIQKIHAKGMCQQTIFSNWDLHSYPLLLESEIGEKIQRYIPFDTAIFSGPLHLLKPDRRIFKKLTGVWDIKPENILVVDDQEENILRAKKLGFQAIQVFNRDIKPVELLLRQRGIIG